MRSDRGRSFVVEPGPPGASRPRPCPPPPALGGSQGAPPPPRGLLKRHALSALGTPQRLQFPGPGRGVDPGGGGAEREGALHRAARAGRLSLPCAGFRCAKDIPGWRVWRGEEGRVRIPNLESGCSKAVGSLREGGTDRLRSGAQKSLWPPGGWPTVQPLWPGGVLDPKGSRCPVAAGSLGQIIQAQLFWALNPWTSYGPSPGKCPSCTVRCTHILTSTKVRVHTRLCKCIRGFPGPSPGARLSHAALAITGPPHGWRKPVHTHPLPRGHIRPEMDPAGLSGSKLQRILPRLRRLHSAESRIRSGQKRGTK